MPEDGGIFRVYVSSRDLAPPGTILKGNLQEGLYYEVHKGPFPSWAAKLVGNPKRGRFSSSESSSPSSGKKVYIKDPSQVPSGVQVEEGGRGGHYYIAKPGQSAPEEQSQQPGKQLAGNFGQAMARRKDEHRQRLGLPPIGPAQPKENKPQQAKPTLSPKQPLQQPNRGFRPPQLLTDQNFSNVKSFADAGLKGGIHAEVTFIAEAKQGTLAPNPGLSPSRCVYKIPEPDSSSEAPAELGAFAVSDVLGWGIVPDVNSAEINGQQGHTMRWVDESGFGGSAFLGMKIGFDELANYFQENPAYLPSFVRMSALDLIIDNPDRHGGNFVLNPDTQSVYAIDNGYGFMWGTPAKPKTFANVMLGQFGIFDHSPPIMKKLVLQEMRNTLQEVSDKRLALTEAVHKVHPNADRIFETTLSAFLKSEF